MGHSSIIDLCLGGIRFGNRPCYWLQVLRRFVVFLSPSHYMPTRYIQIGHRNFIPDALKYTVYNPILFHPAAHSYLSYKLSGKPPSNLNIGRTNSMKNVISFLFLCCLRHEYSFLSETQQKRDGNPRDSVRRSIFRNIQRSILASGSTSSSEHVAGHL
jgi:hypothetical protein